MPIVPGPGRLRLEDVKFKDSLDYILIPNLKKIKTIKLPQSPKCYSSVRIEMLGSNAVIFTLFFQLSHIYNS